MDWSRASEEEMVAWLRLKAGQQLTRAIDHYEAVDLDDKIDRSRDDDIRNKAEVAEVNERITALFTHLDSGERSLSSMVAFTAVLYRENMFRTRPGAKSPAIVLADMAKQMVAAVHEGIAALYGSGKDFSNDIGVAFDALQAFCDARLEESLDSLGPHAPNSKACKVCSVSDLARRGHAASKILLAYSLLLASGKGGVEELAPSEALAEAYLSTVKLTPQMTERATIITSALLAVPIEASEGLAGIMAV